MSETYHEPTYTTLVIPASDEPWIALTQPLSFGGEAKEQHTRRTPFKRWSHLDNY
jgi:hypothetical protein